jgi:hypothetical protein
MRIILFCCLVFLADLLTAQTPANAYLSLQPYEVHEHDNPFKLNISFGPYKTQRIRRALGPLFSFDNFSIQNTLLDFFDIPFHTEYKERSKDVFSFDLKQGDSLVSSVRCRAILYRNERVRLLKPADASFFGANNVDFLQAVIVLHNDTNQVWQMAASNLNGSMNEPQKGLLRHDTLQISFEKTTMLLREKAVDRTDVSSLLATLNMVYTFSYQNQVVAAISYKDADKRVWFHEKLDPAIAHAIASADMILTLRRQLYK